VQKSNFKRIFNNQRERVNTNRKMEKTKTDLQVRDEEDAQAGIEIWEYVFGFTSMVVVKCAIELGIAETIEKHGGPITLEELSASQGYDPSSLHRIIRFLVHHGFLKEKPTGQGNTIGYIQLPLSSRLLRGTQNNMADSILLESSPVMLEPWLLLSSRVRANGNSTFEGVHGQDVWKYCAANSGHNKLIDDAMACNARLAVAALVKGCPEVFHGINTFVDVGGGNGIALSSLVKAFPWIQGINFDLPHVVSVAPVRDGWVLHDWNDEECITILKKCKEAIARDKGKVIIVEAVVSGEQKDDKLEYVRLMLDMVMTAHTDTDKERTFKEWEDVILKAGFSRFNIKPIGAVQSIIEIFP
ncbi:hypothetical protein Tsubulata_006132, partial [Turnera subulata]